MGSLAAGEGLALGASLGAAEAGAAALVGWVGG
jgi:hypothetical protein